MYSIEQITDDLVLCLNFNDKQYFHLNMAFDKSFCNPLPQDPDPSSELFLNKQIKATWGETHLVLNTRFINTTYWQCFLTAGLWCSTCLSALTRAKSSSALLKQTRPCDQDTKKREGTSIIGCQVPFCLV